MSIPVLLMVEGGCALTPSLPLTISCARSALPLSLPHPPLPLSSQIISLPSCDTSIRIIILIMYNYNHWLYYYFRDSTHYKITKSRSLRVSPIPSSSVPPPSPFSTCTPRPSPPSACLSPSLPLLSSLLTSSWMASWSKGENKGLP